MLASSGEMTPPCGVPATVRSELPLHHHTRLQPQADQLQHPPVRHPPAHLGEQPVMADLAEEVADVELRDKLAQPAMNPVRSRSIACVADRLGRNPYEHGGKSASKTGSSTILAACWATLSRTAGMPSGRLPPCGFGMSTRLAGAGRYVPSRRSA